MKTEEIALSRVSENEANPRTITEANFQKLVKSILVFPKMLQLRPIVVDETYKALGGNMRTRALCHIVSMTPEAIMDVLDTDQRLTDAEKLAIANYWSQWQEQPTATIVKASDLTEAQKKEFIIKDNVGFGDWDVDTLNNQWNTDLLKDWGIQDWQLQGWMSADSLKNGELGDIDETGKKSIGNVEMRFLIPPFSVLDTRQGRWQKRKKYWLDMGIVSEKGRRSELTYQKSMQTPFVYSIRNKLREKNGKDLSWQEIEQYCKDNNISFLSGTSVFDPVLCECAYRWFMPKGGKFILDPFCGGSVRGIVASKCGFEYFGRDLREEQIEANLANVNEVCSDDELKPEYSCGDSQYIGDVYEEGKADLIFSCPPYADLEVYSKDEADISNMPYPKFLEVYRKIIEETCKCLHENRFAVWVVSEVRGKDGEYYNLVADTIKAFKDAGLKYYNEMILVNQVSSLAMRVTAQFQKSRKIGRTHQNVLVFFKGDLNRIVGGYDELDLSYLQEEMEEVKIENE